MTQGFWVLFCFSNYFFHHSQGSYLWAFAGLGWLAVLARVILAPNYFEVKGTRLIIHHDFFHSEHVEITDIEKIELADGPFSNSYIRLKDHKPGLKFNYYIVNDNDFNAFKNSLQIKVE